MLDTALKEWSIVCDLLLTGELALLLRKGGIHETGGPGVFELEHPRFLLYPSYVHQKPEMIKPVLRDRVNVLDQEPSEVTFTGLGEAARIWNVPSREAFDQLDDLHCWSPAQIDMRFDYKPQRPLYLMAVRAYKLAQPHTVENHADYSGCRSWVALRPEDAVCDAKVMPVIDNQSFAAIVDRIERGFSRAINL
jgi:hypothetical protein